VQQWLIYSANTQGISFVLHEFGLHPDFKNSKPHWWNGDVAFVYVNPRVDSWFFVMSVFLLVS
jgi:hypothetical protein